MIRQRYQRCFTPSDGDCFRTCVAMVLDLDPEGMPNFCAAEGDWWAAFQKWLGALHLTAVEIRLRRGHRAQMMWVTEGTPCILSGESPRGSWLHSVVGESAGERGWRYLFDPNPEGGFLNGEPWCVLFFVPLRPDLAVNK